MKKAEAFGEFAWDQVPQTHVVDEHDKRDVAPRLSSADPHRNVVRYNRDLRFEIDAVGFIGGGDAVVRTEKRV